MKELRENLLLNTDSYKASHYLQYPPKTTAVSSYIESRGGRWNRTVFFGLQMFLKTYLETPITQEDINEAEVFWKGHGEPFNKEGWQYILDKYDGKLPVTIQAVPEGTVVQTGNVLVQIINNDDNCFWLTSFLETALLRATWYPTTVATNSWMCKKTIMDNLAKTSDDPEAEIAFKLHDFGARGASSMETAGIGGAAHLVNFMGSDTVTGILYAKRFYGEDMAGFSIPAAEHSTMTTWGGEEGEIEAFKHMLDTFGGKYPLIACVSDSYNIWKAVEEKWPSLKEKIINSGSVLVVRPDSGTPVAVVSGVIERLMDKFGYETNKKGFKVLPPYIRVIQGDGVKEESIKDILLEMEYRHLSGSNTAFGMGAALLQNFDRDCLRFAMKASATKVDGVWRDVFKEPITDPGKVSKKGRLALIEVDGAYKTVREDDCSAEDNKLVVVYKDGQVVKEWEFSEIRERANIALMGIYKAQNIILKAA
ncbi:MAG: nicotinate phosphoribosyltransferase [Candidatus Peribacteraceae bacterium]|nr:nicotinate phosphoribosyltransferase [Candidatus Peribacteraceae bacterium]